MLRPNDVVAVALSGGKDSVALLRILWKLERRFPPARLIALTVDEGISDYRREAISISREVCDELKIEHVVFSFDELFGITMDDVASRQNELRPCSYCGVLRRKALNEGARQVGATKLATAHNLDDEAQTALLNVMHGDIERILRSPRTNGSPTNFVPRIKPLAEVPEKETTLYAYASGARFQATPCPHGHDALRGDIRVMLNRLELKHPGLKHTISRSVERLSENAGGAEKGRPFRACAICGDPTPNEACEACLMLRTLKNGATAERG
ncbi:TIGR00269 family protein [bacterium]|nr:MAG: TIGR00269 family protein [bacterium]